MTSEQFLTQIRRQPPAPVYLFLGPETHQRDVCRGALVERVLPEGEREAGFIRHDLEEISLAAVVDDACSLSLFAPRRLLWAGRAEAALPRGRGGAESEGSGAGVLAAYLKNPAPGVVIVLDSSRYEFDGEDKAKQERVRKYYSAVPAVVEFPRLSEQQARGLVAELAARHGLRLDRKVPELLAEATGNSGAAIATEIEKLALFAGTERTVTSEDVARLVPQARSATIFALVAALGRKDQAAALDLLDTLVREGEYLPLALAFLATQFRHALVASEAGLRSPGQVMGYFSRLGAPMWPARAQQVLETVAAFPADQMRSALVRIAAADKALRDTRPDDRIVMEEFVLSLTG